MRMRFPLSVTAIVVLASGCAGGGVSNLRTQVESLPAPERAYITGTYAVDCRASGKDCKQAFDIISLDYRVVGKPELMGRMNWTEGSLTVPATVVDSLDLSAGRKETYFCIAVPPGDLEFYTYSYYSSSRGDYVIPRTDYFSLPFSVARGEVRDIGHLRLTVTAGKNAFGITLPAPGELQVSASKPNESAAALAKCPESARNGKRTVEQLRVPSSKQTKYVREIAR
jgi:hypothetical protein